ncbi:hypothetical protein RI129_000616 [Pyrocoelia pectoralis]|uniref:Retrotransposon gag domain-containing protein n=1 Tax=Pyrocoelia pectoralis TaxID=417401 RepID=A0AAN7VJF2_9COLE
MEQKATTNSGLDPDTKSSGAQSKILQEDPIKAIISALQQLQANKPELPTFAGEPLDDPKTFLVELEKKSPQDDDTAKLKTATKQLKGEAAKWWKTYEGFDLTYEEFKSTFNDQFDTERLRAKLHAEFLSREQKTETCQAFLQRKAQVAKRLRLDINQHLDLLKDLIHPRIRSFLRNTPATTILELVRLAVLYEEDQKAIPKEANAASSPPPERRPNMPRCHFCPEFHFHRDCPVSRQRQDQGNEQAAGISHPRPSN